MMRGFGESPEQEQFKSFTRSRCQSVEKCFCYML